MYRHIFTPTTGDILVTIPQSWYGKNVEIIAFPVPDMPTIEDVAEKRMKTKAVNSKYSFSTKNFKFNRDEANDYD
jgi:hypothetical protein